MTGRGNVTTTVSLPAALWAVTRMKVQMRWMIAWRGIAAAIFWTIGVIGASWLRHVGLDYLVVAAFVFWFISALPALYFQLSLIVDMLGYVFTGKITFFPLIAALSEAKTEDERQEIHRALLPAPLDARVATFGTAKPDPFWSFLASFLSATSPLSCFSMWALIVLVRIPESAHFRITSPSHVNDIQREAGRRIYSLAFARLSHL